MAGVTQPPVALLPFEPPYDVDALLAAQAAHVVPGLDAIDLETRTITRSIRTADGHVMVRVGFGDAHVELEASAPHTTGPTDDLVRIVRHWLDLDTDPAEIADAFGNDPVIGPLVDVRPGLRILGHVEGFEAAAGAVLGQQVSLAAARTFTARFVATFGIAVAEGFTAFPDAATIAASSPEFVQSAVGLTAARARTLHGLAVACAEGLDLNAREDLASLRRELLALRGIGPWTADYLALRAFRDRDAFPVGDLVLRRALGVDTEKAALAAGEAWRPLRAYATFHLWTAASYL